MLFFTCEECVRNVQHVLRYIVFVSLTKGKVNPEYIINGYEEAKEALTSALDGG